MGGKTSTTSSQVQIPPEVLARYNSVNTTAQNVAQTPFQQYSTNPNSFVAPITPTQQYGIQNTNAAAGEAQPYYGAATGFALAGSQAVNPSAVSAGAINQYENPYLQAVLGSTEANVNQQNQQAAAGQTGNAINQGYFGGDRSGIAQAVLEGQQQLTGGQLYSGIASDAYSQALAAAQQQQGVQLGAGQANRAAVQQTGEALAGLGTGAQGAALEGAQQQLAAGQVQQQTQQAGDTALYNQFLQQQSYPFQTAQFLANIAEGTGALSGSTTTSTQPGGLFSDERLKEDMEPIGKGFDGANIYRFRYKGDPTTRIGFSAQEVERKHPEAVSEHQGFKAVDYGAATDDSARRGFALAANDDFGQEPRRARQAGGGMSEWGSYPSGVNPMVIAQLLSAQEQSYAPFAQAGLYGSQGGGSAPYGGAGHVPPANLPVGQLQIARPPTAQPQGGLASDLHSAASLADDAEGIKSDYHLGHQAVDWATHLGSKGGGGGGGAGDGMSEQDYLDAGGHAEGGQVGGDDEMGQRHIARIGRAPGGLTAADYAARAHQQMNEAKIRAAGAAAHAQVAQRTAADHYAATHPDTSFGAPGTLISGGPGVQTLRAGAPPVFHVLHQAADAGNAAEQGLAAQTGAHVMAGLGALGNWAQNVPWTNQRGAGVKPAPPRWVTDPNAYLPRAAPPGAPPAAAAPAARGPPAVRGPPPGAPPPPASAGPVAQYNHHHQQAQAHAAAAQSIADAHLPAPLPDNIPGTTLRPTPGSTLNPTPINVGDTDHLQGGFAPANLQPAHEGLFHRIGDWWANNAPVGLGGDPTSGMTQDAMEAAFPSPQAAAPIQSEAFTRAAPPIQSEAFQPPDQATVGPPALARGGFARAARRRRQDGGDLSNPQNDDPYRPQGPGLNIPTAPTQTPKLATAPAPGGGGGGGLGSVLGAGADIANIAKAAPEIGAMASGIGSGISSLLPLLAFAARGGRVGRADGGPLPGDDPTTPTAPLHDSDATPVAAAADDDTAPAPQPGGFGKAAQPPAGGGGGGGGGFLGSLFHGVEKLGQGVAGMAGYEGHGQWNRDQVVPFVTGIADMLAAPTKYPLVALTQGLKGGAQSYMQQQQNEAALEQTHADAALQRFQAQPLSQQSGYMELPGAKYLSDGMTVDRSVSREIRPGVWVHLGDPSEGGGAAAGAVAAPGLATPQTIQGGHAGANAPTTLPSRGPIQVDYDHGGSQTWAPSTTSDADVQSLGLNTSGGPAAARANRLLINRNQGLQGREAGGQDAITKNEAIQPSAVTNAQNLRMLGQAINSIPPGGLAAMGESYEGRQQILRAVQTARRMVGLPDDEELNRDMTPGDITNKINALASTTMAHAANQNSAEIASALRAILPSGGSSNPAAANHIIAGLMVQNQRDLDFGHFANGYLAKYGTSIGVQQAFQDEMTPVYGQDQATLERMLPRNGRSQSLAEYIQKNPSRLKEFEQGFGGAPGWGTGIGRYFPGGE